MQPYLPSVNTTGMVKREPGQPIRSGSLLSVSGQPYLPSVNITGMIKGEEQVPEKPGRPKGLITKITALPIAAVRGLWTGLAYNIPATLGHLSMGDLQSAAQVPNFQETFKRAYRETGGPVEEFKKGIRQGGAGMGAIYQTFGVGIPATIAYALEPGNEAARMAQAEANQLFPNITKAFTEKQMGGNVVLREFEEHYPQLTSGVSYVTYVDRSGKASQARVGSLQVMDWLEDATKKGWKIHGVEVQPPHPFMPGWVPLVGGATLGQTAAFTADVTDPLLGGLFGKATQLGLRGIKAGGKLALRVPPISRAATTIGKYAGKVTAPGTTVGKVIDDMETWAGSFRKATVKLRQRVYGMPGGKLQSQALRSQMKYQAEVVRDLLEGNNPGAVKLAQQYLNEKAIGGPAGSLRSNALGIKMVNHGLVGPGGDLFETANTIVKIGSMKAEEKLLLNKLALAWREGDTALEDVLARVKPTQIPANIRGAYKLVRGALRGETKLAKAEGAAIKIGDIETITNALTLARGGLGSATIEMEAAMIDFEIILKGAVPDWLKPTPAEISTITAHAPSLQVLSEPMKVRIGAGMKIIAMAEREGMSDFALGQMRRALKTSVDVAYGGGAKFDELVDKYILGMETIQREIAPGVGVTKKLRDKAFAVRQAVEEEALSKGIDIDTLRGAVKLGRDLDELIGKMEVDLGIITKQQFEGLRGLHTRRSYAFFEENGVAERKIAELTKSDPIKAAMLEKELERVREWRGTMENVQALQPGAAFGGASKTAGKARLNLTPEFREMLEQFDNYSDAIAISGVKAAKDIGNHTFYRAIHEAGLAADTPIPDLGMVKLLPKGRAWGALGGKYVAAPLHSDLLRYAAEETLRPGVMQRVWRNWVMRPIKFMLVPGNPVAQRNNFIGNMIAGIGATGETNLGILMAHHVRGLKALLNYDSLAARYAKYSSATREASVMTELNLGKMFVEEASSGLGKRLAQNKGYALTKKIWGKATRTYGWEEAEGKMMIFSYATTAVEKGGLGLLDRDAVLLAEKWMIDYNHVPPIIEWMRSRIGIFPFITYTYKMIGNLIRLPLEKPEVVAKLAKPLLGLEDMVPEDIRQAEHEGIPDWASDKMIIRLPGKESRSMIIDSMLPWNIFETEAMQQAPEGLRTVLGLMGPPYSSLLELMFNRNKLTGADIVPEGTDSKTGSILRGQYLVSQIPQYRYFFKQLPAAIHGKSLRATQNPQRWWEVFASVYNWKLDKTVAFKYKRAKDEYAKTIAYASQISKSEVLSEGEKESRVQRLMQLADIKRKQMVEIGEGMVTIAGLDEILALSGANPEQLQWMTKWFVDQPPPSRELRERVKQIGKTLMPAQSINAVFNPSSPQPYLPSVNTTGLVPAVDRRRLQPNQERLNAAEEGMQATPYTIPAGYEKSSL